MQCMTGGYRGQMHNAVQYFFFDTMKDAGYKDVVWEPELQPLEGETFKFKSAKMMKKLAVMCAFWGSGLGCEGQFSMLRHSRRSP